MNPVSFGSLYTVYVVSDDLKNNNQGHKILRDYCKKNDIFIRTKVPCEPLDGSFLKRGLKIHERTFISAEREKDHDIDMICNNYKLFHAKNTPERIILKRYGAKESFISSIKSTLASIL